MENERAYRPAGRWQDLRVEVKHGIHGFRNLRASLLEFAYKLASHTKERGLLVLVDSRITEGRLQVELEQAAQVILPDVMNRLTVALVKDEQYIGFPPDLGDDFYGWLNQFISSETPVCKPRDSFYVIFQVLLHQWLLGREPMTRKLLGKMTGLSYPTVAGALRRLKPYLREIPDRRVELKYFPHDEWVRLLAVSERVRSTARFASPHGLSRSPEAHLSRLEKAGLQNVALGGVPGTRYYYSGLDLIGTPRLDLSLHCHGKQVDLGFIRELDPTLRPVDNALQPADVVVHIVRRAESFFVHRHDGLYWADRVECLMDLHEAHLERQAKDFLQFIEDGRSEVS